MGEGCMENHINEVVRCRRCKKEYMCLPEDDYYDATNNHDGLCGKCYIEKRQQQVNVRATYTTSETQP